MVIALLSGLRLVVVLDRLVEHRRAQKEFREIVLVIWDLCGFTPTIPDCWFLKQLLIALQRLYFRAALFGWLSFAKETDLSFRLCRC